MHDKTEIQVSLLLSQDDASKFNQWVKTRGFLNWEDAFYTIINQAIMETRLDSPDQLSEVEPLSDALRLDGEDPVSVRGR